MIIVLNTNEVMDALLDDDYAHWSYDAAKALAEFYEVLEDDLDEGMILDIVAIRCKWIESSIEEAREAYSIDDGVDVIEYISNRATCLELDDDNLLFTEF